MKGFNNSEIKVFEHLASLKQSELLKFMGVFLQRHYNQVEINKDYIIAYGDIPIGLVAHLDTVFPKPPTQFFYDKQKNVLWSPEGLGADDRAGIFSILTIVQEGYRPHIILTTDEEMGGIGADVIAQKYHNYPFKNLQFLIQLDRRGANDCVFYDLYAPEFVKYIESFGFVEAWGSFSDISILCPEWQVCGVNLSIGYINEHQQIEHLFVGHMFDTIQKVKKILEQGSYPEFTPNFYSNYDYYSKYYNNYDYFDDAIGYNHGYTCCNCGKTYSQISEVVPAQTRKSNNRYICLDCIGVANWCENCGEAFLTDKGNKQQKCCYTCQPEVKKQKKIIKKVKGANYLNDKRRTSHKIN